MKITILILVLMGAILLWSCSGRKKKKLDENLQTVISDIYSFSVNNISGEEVKLKKYEGKKIMIVNVASKCGLTPQYEGLQKLYDTYKDSNFVILAFPANNFLKQEPGTNDEIKSFCSINYGVTFPVMSKIDVKGKNIHPLYQYLTKKSKNGLKDNSVKWNFQKYLINSKGFLEKVISPSTKPLDKEIVDWVSGN